MLLVKIPCYRLKKNGTYRSSSDSHRCSFRYSIDWNIRVLRNYAGNRNRNGNHLTDPNIRGGRYPYRLSHGNSLLENNPVNDSQSITMYKKFPVNDTQGITMYKKLSAHFHRNW